ncbi:MAG: tRNA (adenosine(37)-N6)-threonylcarbamoyltransferase complex ATPase subunit type 1 TsaE [Anaerolineae bacterium]|nr:tRNA (adenosine(37)-N6)-threonylcarbamoyltransferase complex ATPase subunit type 1 TsaE [Anaerolineae bacterium]
MPIYDPNVLEFLSRSPEQTRRLGIRLGALLQSGDTLCLSGDLGSGKTTFVQGIAQGWGSSDQVSSPTFVLVNVYRRPDGKTIHHLDAYRMQNWMEAEDLDLDLMIEKGALIIEWPERINEVLPAERLNIDLRYVDDLQRGMVFKPVGERYKHVAALFRKQVFGG